MRDRAAAVRIPEHSQTAPPRRRHRVVAGVAVAALTAAGVAAVGLPASATPGTASYEVAFSAAIGISVTDVAIDSYTAQAFAAIDSGVAILNEMDGSTVDTVSLPNTNNRQIDADATRALVWTLDPATGVLSRIDERTNSVTGSVPIPGNPRDLVVDHTTGKVFVTTGTLGTVVPVNETTLALGTAITVGGTAFRIGVDSQAGLLYVVNAAGPSVVLVDEAAGSVTGTVPLPAAPLALTVDADHHRAYLGSLDSDSVMVVDGAGKALGSPIAVPSGFGHGVSALGIDPTTQTVIGRNANQVFRINTENGAIRTWSSTLGAYVLSTDIVADVFTNTVIYGSGAAVTGLWEPVSFLGSVSGVVPTGSPYSQQISSWSIDASPLTFAVTNGSLPPGLTLNSDTISGTATTPGSYTFDLTATVPSNGESVTQTYTLRVVTVNRTAGSDRFATSVEVSKAAYPDPATVGTVYVANGISFPDALSGGPAAAQDSGPLLLTAPGYLPASVSAEIARLHPAHIVVVGGPAVVSDDVLTTLRGLSTDVQRVYGGDRFGTSQAVIRHSFTSAPTVYVSTGLNFPDSLSAGGAAGSLHAPLLLVNGNATSVDPATAQLLHDLGTTHIVVIGGSAVMSPSLVADFAHFGTVLHLAGVDRFDSSQQIVETAFASSNRVILANGLNFPDALGASAWAGKSASPLFITLGGCVPQRTLDDIFFLGATSVTLVGGTSVLAPEVAGLTSCGGASIVAPAYPALAPVVAKKSGGSASGSVTYDHPVAPTLPVNPRTHGDAGH
ncbi:cell wall-binding repeat-containing protein [Leifsonia sp. 22587]|uniref:cell wall-binding repeat-containing protein n=1 Tax=Leifsonia sp. 22587 TaxID=3453946 RepID=UPI003F872787